MFFKEFGSKDPCRLFIAGVHGNEEATTMPLLELVHEYRPTIYLELHSYEIRNHAKLTDPDRKSKVGVPSFTELEENFITIQNIEMNFSYPHAPTPCCPTPSQWGGL